MNDGRAQDWGTCGGGRELAPLMASGYADVLKVAGQILQNTGIINQEKASALRQSFLPELRSLHAQAKTFQGDGGDVARVNEHLVASLRTEISAFESAATAYGRATRGPWRPRRLRTAKR